MTDSKKSLKMETLGRSLLQAVFGPHHGGEAGAALPSKKAKMNVIPDGSLEHPFLLDSSSESESDHEQEVQKYFKGDDVMYNSGRFSEIARLCKVVEVYPSKRFKRLYKLVPYDAGAGDKYYSVIEKDMKDPNKVEKVPFVEQESTFSEKLLKAASEAGVCIARTMHGYGVIATRPLEEGHVIPYWGKIVRVTHENASYNARISTEGEVELFVAADNPEDRGPGAFCNDNTVFIDERDRVQRTRLLPNAEIMVLMDGEYKDVFEDYTVHGGILSNPEKLQVYVQVTTSIPCGQEVFVSYGDEYWGL
jgi:hypothetical protein